MSRLFVLAGLAAGLCGSAADGRAASTPSVEITAEIQVGFSGYVVPDVWIPVSVRLRSARDIAGTVEVMTSRARPAGRERVRQDVHLTAGTPFPVTLPALVRDLHAPVIVRLLQEAAVLAEWRVMVPPARLVEGVVLAVSRRPLGLQQVLGEGDRVRVAYVAEVDLPSRWQLYEGVTAVVVRDLDDRRLVPAQMDALQGWVAAGGRVLVPAPTAEGLARAALRPLLAVPSRPATFPAAGEREHPWGRGQVTVVPLDPFRSALTPDEAAVWARLLRAPRRASFVDPRALLAALPQSPGTSLWLQVAILAVLGLYLVLLRSLTRGLLRGRSGWVLAAVLLAGATLLAGTLNLAVRRRAATIVQGVIVQGLPDQGAALVESVGRVVLPRRGPFLLQASADTLARALDGGDTMLTLNQVVRFEGSTDAPLPVRAVALIPLAIRGLYREGPQGVEVQIENRSGRPLRDPIAFLDGRIQPLPPLDKDGRATLSPLLWHEPPEGNAARSTMGRLLAWAFSRLRGDAILSPTVHLVAWLDDDRGALRWGTQPAAPQLLILPLGQAEGAP